MTRKSPGNLGTLDVRQSFMSRFPSNMYQLLDRGFWENLNGKICKDKRKRKAKHAPNRNACTENFQQRKQEVYFRFVFSMQFHSGIAAKDGLKWIMALRVADFRKVLDRWIYLQRFGGEWPVYLGLMTKICAQSLLLVLAREGPRRKGKKRIGKLDGTARVVDLVFGNVLGEEEIIVQRGRYREWVNKLAKASHHEKYYLSHKAFLQIIQHQFSKIMSRSYLELLLAKWSYKPAPVEQRASFWELANPIDLMRVKDYSVPRRVIWESRLPNELGIWLGLDPADEEVENSAAFFPKKVWPKEAESIKQEIRILQELTGLEDALNQDEKKKRRDFINKRVRNLKKIIRQIESRLNLKVNVDLDWGAYINGKKAAQFGDQKNDLIILSSVARWLIYLIKTRKLSPSGVAGKMYTLLNIAGKFPGRLPFRLYHDQLDELKEYGGYARATLQDYLITLQLYRKFVRTKLGCNVSQGIKWTELIDYFQPTYYVELLTRDELEQILGCLRQFGDMGGLAYYAVILQVLFGSRGSSTCNVRIDGYSGSGFMPTLTVPNTKKRDAFDSQRGPDEEERALLDEIDVLHKQRLKETAGDDKQFLLATAAGEKLTYARYRRLLNRAMGILKIEKKVGISTAVSHLFRHYAANRWLAKKGYSIRVIRDRLNHRQDSTSVESYLHGVPFRLAEYIEKSESDYGWFLKRGAVAYMFGYAGVRQIRNVLKQGPLAPPRHTRLSLFDFERIADQMMNTNHWAKLIADEIA